MSLQNICFCHLKNQIRADQRSGKHREIERRKLPDEKQRRADNHHAQHETTEQNTHENLLRFRARPFQGQESDDGHARPDSETISETLRC